MAKVTKPMAPRYISVPFNSGGPILPIVDPSLTATTVNGSQINLSIAYTGPPGAVTYVFESATSGVGPFVPLSSGTSSAFSDTGLLAATTYFFRARVQVTDGRFSNFSTVKSATTLNAVPTAPTGVSATGTGQTTVLVSWNVVSQATGYNVYRAGSLVAGPLATNSFADSGLVPGTAYSYTVSALNGAGEGPQSTASSGTTFPATGSGISKLHPGHGFWFDNQYWPGAQQSNYNAHINGFLVNPNITHIKLALTLGALMDDALDANGNATYASGFSIFDGVLATLRTANHPMYLTVTWWQTFFNTTSVSSTGDWPQWVINKGNWIKAFTDLSGTTRTQLDWDNDEIWSYITKMFQAYGDRYNNDPNFELINTMDESVAVSVIQGGSTTMNSAHYNAKFKQMHLDIKPHWGKTLINVPFNFLPPGDGVTDVAAMQDMITTFESNYPGGFMYGGPDPATNRNVHNNPNGRWITTFQNMVDNQVGSLGNKHGHIALFNNIEEFLLGNRIVNGVPQDPGVTPAQLLSDAVGLYKAQICIWNCETWEFYKLPDVLAAINAVNGQAAAPPDNAIYDNTPGIHS